MNDKFNFGNELKELKLGSTFSDPCTSFHTLKYDFKPASVDLNKEATLDVSSNSQVTVTLPHLDGSGIPKTVFKGNQRNYSKECVLIIDKVSGEITLQKLQHNIQVKKTRTESAPKSLSAPPNKLENHTQRTISKTKVTTGGRKKNIGGFGSKQSPIQGSPTYTHHKSPQSAPAWNANNNQQTLPSIPMIGLDDDDNSTSSMMGIINHSNISAVLIPEPTPAINNFVKTMPAIETEPTISIPTHDLHTANNNHNHEIGVLTSSDSSSDSETSNSESDSDSSSAAAPSIPVNNSRQPPMKAHNITQQQSVVANTSNSLPTHLLTEDLCLSESNSESDND